MIFLMNKGGYLFRDVSSSFFFSTLFDFGYVRYVGWFLARFFLYSLLLGFSYRAHLYGLLTQGRGHLLADLIRMFRHRFVQLRIGRYTFVGLVTLRQLVRQGVGVEVRHTLVVTFFFREALDAE